MLHSLKMLTAYLGLRHGVEATLSLDETNCPGELKPRRRFEADPEWSPDALNQLATLFCIELFPCHVTIEPVMTGTSKLTVTTGEPVAGDVTELEKALESVFNCIGVVQGQRILTEVLTA